MLLGTTAERDGYYVSRSTIVTSSSQTWPSSSVRMRHWPSPPGQVISPRKVVQSKVPAGNSMGRSDYLLDVFVVAAEKVQCSGKIGARIGRSGYCLTRSVVVAEKVQGSR